MYGGNGQTNFALPELRGRCVMHVGNSFSLQGQVGGEEVHTLTVSEMPQHVHLLSVSSLDANVPIATGNRLAAFNNGYIAPGNLTTIAPETVSAVGGSQPHNNMSPYIAVNFCIALQGVFPSQN
jgi:microcystin-dependent protein